MDRRATAESIVGSDKHYWHRYIATYRAAFARTRQGAPGHRIRRIAWCLDRLAFGHAFQALRSSAPMFCPRRPEWPPDRGTSYRQIDRGGPARRQDHARCHRRRRRSDNRRRQPHSAAPGIMSGRGNGPTTFRWPLHSGGHCARATRCHAGFCSSQHYRMAGGLPMRSTFCWRSNTSGTPDWFLNTCKATTLAAPGFSE